MVPLSPAVTNPTAAKQPDIANNPPTDIIKYAEGRIHQVRPSLLYLPFIILL